MLSFIFQLSLSLWAGSAVSVLTQHNDSSRTGANLNEAVLNTSVNVNQFGKLFSRFVGGQIYAQPLYVPNLAIPKQGTHNVVFVATTQNRVFAFDADDPAAAEPLWQATLEPSVPVPHWEFGNRYGPYTNIAPEIGIIGTPVIDRESATLYVVTFNRDGNGRYYQRLHALDITTGGEKFDGPAEIRGSVPGLGYDHASGVVTFNPMQHLQRPALLLSNSMVFIAFASHADSHPYHGWVFGYRARDLRQPPIIYNTTPNGREGGIWQAGGGLVADSEGNIYFMTGNGDFDQSPNQRNFGTSFVKLQPSATGFTLVDWFTPFNQADLNRRDFDLGSAGPLLIPGTPFIVGGGKEGKFYLIDRNRMGHFHEGDDSQIVQSFRSVNGHIHGSPVYWSSPNGPRLYVWSEEDYLKSFSFDGSRFNPTPVATSRMRVPGGMPGGMLSLSADGSTPGTGIIWAIVPTFDAVGLNVRGILRAFDASNLTELWNSTQNERFDDVGAFAKFSAPTIANGKVYVPTFSGQLHVYGLLPDNPPPLISLSAPTNGEYYTMPADITLEADVMDRGDDVMQVDFYADDTLIGTAKTSPYQVDWNNVPAGNHTLTAIATNGQGATAMSDPVQITVSSNPINPGQVLSINFVGGGERGVPNLMGVAEIAGVVARDHWNNLLGGSGNFRPVVDDTGLSTGATVSWVAGPLWASLIEDTPGNNRMMKGYISTLNDTITSVLVDNLPETFTRNGYDVYVYVDGDTGRNWRSARYTIGPAAIWAENHGPFHPNSRGFGMKSNYRKVHAFLGIMGERKEYQLCPKKRHGRKKKEERRLAKGC
jgi:hypothetical protein